jgi:hypothetical protein
MMMMSLTTFNHHIITVAVKKELQQNNRKRGPNASGKDEPQTTSGMLQQSLKHQSFDTLGVCERVGL